MLLHPSFEHRCKIEIQYPTDCFFFVCFFNLPLSKPLGIKAVLPHSLQRCSWGSYLPRNTGGGGTLEQAAQEGCGCPTPRGIQGQAGCGCGQPGLLPGDHLHGTGTETR